MKNVLLSIRYINENYNFWCNSSWCDNCSTKDIRNEDEYKITLAGYCTCIICDERKIKE